jgi:hypothetical protein
MILLTAFAIALVPAILMFALERRERSADADTDD